MVRFIQYTGERFMPQYVFPRQFSPKRREVFFSFGAEGVISFSAGYVSLLNECGVGGKNAGFMQNGFDRGHEMPPMSFYLGDR
jgi:hypothetical protein